MDFSRLVKISDAQLNQDIVFISTMMSYNDKLQLLHWGATNNSLHERLGELYDETQEYKDTIAEVIMGVLGQFDANLIPGVQFTTSNDPLRVVEELKDFVQSWINTHTNDPAYEGARNATSGYLETLDKYNYLFRISTAG